MNTYNFYNELIENNSKTLKMLLNLKKKKTKILRSLLNNQYIIETSKMTKKLLKLLKIPKYPKITSKMIKMILKSKKWQKYYRNH